MTTRPGRAPRILHPIAWWIWALGIAVAVSRTVNPTLLFLALAVLGFVVARRRTDAPWARAFKYYLGFGVFVITSRVIFHTVFGSGITPTDHILIHLPQLATPGWYSGVTIGGPVSLEGTLTAAALGLRLATLICCVGAANALANPKRALRVLPGALYELGMAIVVAISVAPQLIESVQRVTRARRLRAGGGRGGGGLRALRSVVIPVLEDALERSLLLARAMDSRGYGRSGNTPRASRRITAALMILGMVGLCMGIYGLLDRTAPRYLGFPTILVGAASCCAGLALGGRRVTRTQYRPDPWRLEEWIVAGCGVASAALMILAYGFDATGVNPSFYPLHYPPFPGVAAVGFLLGALAGVVAPPPPRASRPPAPAPPTSADARQPAPRPRVTA
jgi:energy-coupling factor transport system permease protein